MSTLEREYFGFYIDGAWRPSASTDAIDVISPRSGERIGDVPAATAGDIDAAVEAARRAFDDTDWARRPVGDRAELCRSLATAIADHQQELAELFTEEMGCTYFLSDVYQATAPTLHWNYYAAVGEQYDFAEVRESDLSPLAGAGGGGIVPFAGKSLVVKEPVGVVAVMCAYNFALACVAQKAGPALVAGCTVVVKVPEQNPLAIFAMGDLITQAGFPPGVINIVAARAESAERLVRHPDVDMVSFTGSTAVGKRIGEICGSLVRPCVLELGGKSAAIVLPDADLEQALPVLVGASVGTNAGQSCVCLSRILVPRDRHDEIAAQLVAAFEGLKVGDPMEPDTVVSPLISQAHRERVLGYIATGVAEGATLATGGKVPAYLPNGWFVEPTLLTNVTNDMIVAQEEIFGPVVVLIAYEDEEDAIRIANDSEYGLSGAVFAADPAHGFELARRIRSGTYSVNTFAADFNSPFGGYKRSGIGREHGVAGLEGYLLTKTISVDPSAALPAEVVADVTAAPAVV
jgi:aldehyde dehydrogenase (NAD+)